jgi:two-component system, OmpR family, sensor histidine kinase VicK
MDYNKQITEKLTLIIAVFLVIFVALFSGIWLISSYLFRDDPVLLYFFSLTTTLFVALILAKLLANIVNKPLKTIFEIIVYAGHSNRGGVAPNVDKLRLGRKLVTSLAHQIYDLASMSQESHAVMQENEQTFSSAQTKPTSISIIDQIGIPLFGINSDQKITIINRAAREYIDKKEEKIIGKPFYDVVSLSFQGEETFEQWLRKSQQNTAVGNKVWERVCLADSQGDHIKQFDLNATFSKDNQSGTETMLAIFDRSEKYFRDDSEINFVSLAVHELRTPLTIMHGYIEVFEDEIGPELNSELADFMHKMKASAQQLTAFVGNILNVARVDENQLYLTLQRYNWSDIINFAIQDLEIRAEVNNIRIDVHTEENLPPVAVDQISIHEVINNLVDNAIKYSENSNKITIKSILNSEGMVEVSIQDYGIGIPLSAMHDLFKKFYRSHKSNFQVGGTGLGLYLCKALISAHGGNIWVRSKEGEGSIFTFTVQPYDKINMNKLMARMVL